MARARVTIVGMGLIGTSLGLALRKAKPEIEVVGHDSNTDATKRALKAGAIEKSDWNLISACEGADILVLATPANAVKEVFTTAGAYLQKTQLVTDTVSAKVGILQWAKELLPAHVAFVGGDPIVGPRAPSESPSADLFQGATYCLCPAATTPEEAIRLAVGLVELIGAVPYFVDPHEHDGYLAMTDQLSAVISAALLRMTASGGPAERVAADLHRMVGPTFRRASDFSSEDLRTYRDLTSANRENIVRWIGTLEERLAEIKALLVEGDAAKLQALFEDAYVTRSVIGRPYVDKDLATQSDSMRQTTGMGFSELFLGRRLADRTKQAGNKR